MLEPRRPFARLRDIFPKPIICYKSCENVHKNQKMHKSGIFFKSIQIIDFYLNL